MSGFEIVGVVLGAFPLLIEALGKYEEVSRRYGFWKRIRPEYRKCTHDLKYHSDVFRMNLRQLLLPQIVDDDMIEKMISDPVGAEWKSSEMAGMLRTKLQRSYDIYLEIMNRFQETMDELRQELAVESGTIQGKMDGTENPQSDPRNPQVLLMERIKYSISKSNRDYQLYRLKFSNGEGTRRRLLNDLKEQNERLEKLLLNSDKEAYIISQKSSQTTSLTYEHSLCEFWRKATALFRVLCRSISCGCMNDHQASILLQHPRVDASKHDVHVLLVTQKQQHWGYCKARIELTREYITQPEISMPPSYERQGAADQRAKMPLYQYPEGNIPLKSAMKIRHASEPVKKKTSFIQTTTSISFDDTTTLPGKLITDLCKYLQEREHNSGYLVDDECRYQVYPDASLTVPSSSVVTLHQVLHRQGQSLSPPLSRRQRYALALTLASSFVQLIESPWFSSHWSKNDVLFLSGIDQPGHLQIEQPHVCQKLEQPKLELLSPLLGGLGPEGQDSLSRLAIALLELCFGSTLDSQPYRRKWPEGQTEQEKAAFDLAAALEWLKDVNEEAGQDYANAVAWCLVGSRTLTGDASSWRREMVQRVIRPLDACHGYLM